MRRRRGQLLRLKSGTGWNFSTKQCDTRKSHCKGLVVYCPFSFLLIFSLLFNGKGLKSPSLPSIVVNMMAYPLSNFTFQFPDLKCLEQLPLTTRTLLKELHLIFPKRSGSSRSELNNQSVLLMSCSTGALAPPTAPSSSSGSSVLWTGMLNCSIAGRVCGAPSGPWLSSPCEGYRI